MDSRFKLVFVKTSNISTKSKTNLSTKGVVNGELFVHRPNNFEVENFQERVRIIIGIRGFRTNNKFRGEKDWQQILDRQNPLSTNTNCFQISEENWFADGITWVVPTNIFSTTTFRIDLRESFLLTSGFIIEVYQRDTAFVNDVEPSFNLRSGAVINFKTSWHLHSNPVQTSSSVRPKTRTNSEDSEED